MADADQIGRMLRRQPQVVAYKSLDDLVLLKEWFYDFERVDNRSRAVQRVKALNSRGRLPHAIESTSLLTSICITDPATVAPSVQAQADSNMLQLSYSMALTRFVNGLLDPLQQSNYAIPLHQLAKSLQVPSFFVELRHMATHEKLPSLEMLRIAARDALNWLFEHYWSKIEDMESNFGEDDVTSTLSSKDQAVISEKVKSYTGIIEDLISNLKTYRKIRKQDLDYVYKYGNSSETGTKYWKAVNKIKTHLASAHSELVFKVLITKDCIIYNQDDSKAKKITSYLNLLYKLYGPLLDELGTNMKIQLYNVIISYLTSNVAAPDVIINKRLGLEIHKDFETTQLAHWVVHLISEIVSFPDKSTRDFAAKVLEDIEDIGTDQKLIILQGISSLTLPEEVSSKVISLASALRSLQKFEQVESLDSLLGSETDSDNIEEPARKRPKANTDTKAQTGSSHYVFERHTEWEPTPFGSVV